jgi:hypothetical protein
VLTPGVSPCCSTYTTRSTSTSRCSLQLTRSPPSLTAPRLVVALGDTLRGFGISELGGGTRMGNAPIAHVPVRCRGWPS